MNDPMTNLIVSDTPKMIRETLCVAQSAMLTLNIRDRVDEHVDRLQQLIDACDFLRPLGPDGKHRDFHTPHCGCTDIETPVTETFYRACYYLGGEFETVKFVEARSIEQAVELAQKRTPWGSCYYVDICTRVEDPETGEITCQTRRLSPHELFRVRFAIHR